MSVSCTLLILSCPLLNVVHPSSTWHCCENLYIQVHAPQKKYAPNRSSLGHTRSSSFSSYTSFTSMVMCLIEMLYCWCLLLTRCIVRKAISGYLCSFPCVFLFQSRSNYVSTMSVQCMTPTPPQPLPAYFFLLIFSRSSLCSLWHVVSACRKIWLMG